MNTHSSRFLLLLGLALIAGMLVTVRIPAAAAPLLQLTEFPTPTPGPDGRILYIVQEGDTLWRIAAISGLTLDELRQLNNLDAEAIINPGDVLLLGFTDAGQDGATATPEGVIPTPDIGSLPPTPTSGPGTGTICVLLYDDVNGDALRQTEEVAIPDGAVSLTNRTGTISLQEATISGPADPADDPPRICFEDLLEGAYSVTVAIPDGYNATTDLTAEFDLIPGDITLVDFGAQKSSSAIIEEQAAIPEEGGQSPLFGILGGLLLLSGLVLAAYALFSGRR